MKSSTTPQVREWLSYISTKKPEVIYSDRSILGWHTVSVSIKRNTRLQPLSECLGPLATFAGCSLKWAGLKWCHIGEWLSQQRIQQGERQ